MPKQDIYICRTHLTFPAKTTQDAEGKETAHSSVSFGPGEEIPAALFIERGIKASAYIRNGQLQVRTIERKSIPVDPEVAELEREIAKLEEE